jgi:hypothetical protein
VVWLLKAKGRVREMVRMGSRTVSQAPYILQPLSPNMPGYASMIGAETASGTFFRINDHRGPNPKAYTPLTARDR